MPPRKLPPLNAVRTFESAGRHLSFLHAAEELGVTPGAVSRQIKVLEENLGAPLFQRGHRVVTLTRAGADYHREVREALERLATASDAARGPGRRATVSICAHPTLAIRWLVPLWGRFYDRHPEIDLQLTTSLAAVDFDRESFDACVRVGNGRWTGCRSMLLTEVDLFPVCNPALAYRLQRPADLRSAVLLHSAPRPEDWQRWLSSTGEEGVDATRGPIFESLNLAFQAAIEGVGVAMGIGALVAGDLASGRLVAPFSQVRRSGNPFWLVWPERNDANPRLRAFVSWLATEIESRQTGENPLAAANTPATHR